MFCSERDCKLERVGAVGVKRLTWRDSCCIKQCLLRINTPPQSTITRGNIPVRRSYRAISCLNLAQICNKVYKQLPKVSNLFVLVPERLDISRNVLNWAASSLRRNRANCRLPFSNQRRNFSFKTTVTVFQDEAFRSQKLRKCATDWAAERDFICLKKQTRVNKTITSSNK